MKPIAFPNYIESKRIYLRFLQIADADTLFSLIDSQRGYLGKHLEWVEKVKTLRDEKKYVKNKIEQRQNYKSFDWCIFKNGTDEFLGYIGTDPVNTELFKSGNYIDWENGTISFGYFLKKAANGHGYMTEALDALKDISLKLGFSRIEINSEAANIKSQEVAERCGFVHEEKDSGKMYFEKNPR